MLLARAAIKQPRLLILDEPCQGLDTVQRRTLLGTVDCIVARTGASLILVSRREDELPRCITHVLRLVAGRIQEAGRNPPGQAGDFLIEHRRLTPR